MAVLSHQNCLCIVHHGAGNTFNEALYYGIPQLVLSIWMDCRDNATHAETSGIRLHSTDPPYFSGEEILSKVGTIVENPNFEQKAQYWMKDTMKSDGIEGAIKVLRKDYISAGGKIR